MIKTASRGDAEAILAPAHFLIVLAPYYEEIAAMLLSGAKAAMDAAQATYDIVRVPGALEVPTAIKLRLDSAERHGQPLGGAIALGCIIRGETYHFEVVANESARGLISLGTRYGLPIGNGILTVENEEQARIRADPGRGDKGGEAARAALILWRISQDSEAAR